MKNSRSHLLHLALSALFAAIICAGAFVSVPLPGLVPIAIQNMFSVLAGLVLGPLWGMLSVALYMAAGAVGAPVFAGAQGGFVVFASPPGGYLWGYLIAAGLAGLIAGSPKAGRRDALPRMIIAVAAAMLVVYVPGVIQLKFLLHLPWKGALVSGVVPFLIGDAIKGAVLVLVAPRLRRVAASLN
jgi:biotin transport system substrate-specific component